ncbi:MAG TPA: phage major capsid protein [Patescibacteria group bacterium]|nr:phage major capsid protein [Patescibacteria group bacterium]
MPTITQMAEQLHAERTAIAAQFDAARQADGTYNLSAEEVGALHKRNDDLTALQKQHDAAVALEGLHRDVKGALAPQGRVVPGNQPGDGPASQRARSWNDIIAPSAAALKTLASGGRGSASWTMTDAEYKALLTLADISPQADRQETVPSAQYLADVTPLFQTGATDSNNLEYFEETTYISTAAEVAEGTAVADATLDFTLRTDNVTEISVWIPVTRQSLDDNAGLQSYVGGRLRHMLNARRSLQLIGGDGTPPNLSGVLDRSGIQTQPRGADPSMDAIHRAITRVAVAGDATPDAIVAHPNDWQEIRLTRTADGIYILGNPGDPGTKQLWGLPVVTTTSIAEHTALVGAFRSMAQVFNRDGITVEASTEHEGYFTQRRVALLVYQRLALCVYRPAAFCTVTGI